MLNNIKKNVKWLAVVLGIVLLCGCGKEEEKYVEADGGQHLTADLEEGFSAEPEELPADAEESSFTGPEESPAEPEEGLLAEPEEMPEEQAELSDEEKEFFTGFIREEENYGFLLSDYDVPENVDIHEVLYSGAGFGGGIPEEDIPAYLAASGQEGLETDCLKFPKQDIEEFLQRKLGIEIDEISSPLGWLYLPEFDAYYHEAGDTNYMPFSCEGGSRRGNVYTLHFISDEDWGPWLCSCETVIIKIEDGYRFLSNHILKD